MFDEPDANMMLRGIDLKPEPIQEKKIELKFCDDNSISFSKFFITLVTSNPVTQIARLPPRKICSRCGFSKEESESPCYRCRNGQEPHLTYARTSRCAKCGVKNDVEQICEYCRNALGYYQEGI
jgi:hypothetical protein